MMACQVEGFLLLSQVEQQKFKGALAYWRMVFFFFLPPVDLNGTWEKNWCDNSSTSLSTEVSLDIFFVYIILQFPT